VFAGYFSVYPYVGFLRFFIRYAEIEPRGSRLIRILIVDDYKDYRGHLKALLESVEEWNVCGEAENGRDAIEKHLFHQPHVTVMDFNMPELDGLRASRLILAKCPDHPILMLTVFASSQLAAQARREGIKGLCSKIRIDCITVAIQSLLRGETYFPDYFAATAGD
jgi:DNA-binding NarL/FixJ family response regulator